MSARHSLDDRRNRRARRERAASRASWKGWPTRLLVGGNVPRAEVADAMQKSLHHAPDARQWNARNVPRLYDLVEVPNPKAKHAGQPKKIWVRRRTSFRNVIDANGRHV